MITIIDITKIANDLNLKVTEKEKQETLSRYEEEQKNDPTATWNLVVENILYQLINERAE